MVAKEAHTSSSVKDLIVTAPGVDDANWEGTYIRLMFVEKEERWIDLSLRNLTGDWLRRVEERFAGMNGGGAKASALQSFASLDNPHSFVKDFFAKYPASSTQLLASEDKAHFLAISQRRGQKPVPFIPIFDADFNVWFKKVLYSFV
jgi:fatty acid synthase subunit alpha, fungi type